MEVVNSSLASVRKEAVGGIDLSVTQNGRRLRRAMRPMPPSNCRPDVFRTERLLETLFDHFLALRPERFGVFRVERIRADAGAHGA